MLCGQGVALALALSGCDRQAPSSEPEVAAPSRPTLAFAPLPPRAQDTPGLSETQALALRRRVEEKWRAMERRDFGAVYEYTTPNYRKVFTKPMFLNKFGPGIRWELTGIRILHYDASAGIASVGVRVMTGPPEGSSSAPGFSVTDTVKEKWLLIDGEWWNNAK